MKFHFPAVLIAVVSNLLTPYSYAQSLQETVITVTVNVTRPACVVNNNEVIDVNFGDSVVTTDVEQGSYAKAIHYTLDCGAESQQLKMQISGNVSGFSDRALQSNIDDLGIEILKDGIPFPINSAMTIDYEGPGDGPPLTALLISRVNSRLPTGAFSASATMSVEYL